jgi:hypothetical protein
MKVLLGWGVQEHGTVEVTPGGLAYSGPDPEHTAGIVEHQREWYDCAGVKHRLTGDRSELDKGLCSRWVAFAQGMPDREHPRAERGSSRSGESEIPHQMPKTA